MDEELEWLVVLQECYNLYFRHSSRSNKKVLHLHLHLFLKDYITRMYPRWNVKIEERIPMRTFSKFKRADVVIYDEDGNMIVYIPTKIICSNYKQNRCNYLEQLVGECMLIRLENPNIKIIPINVYPYNCPYYRKDKTIKSIECINNNDISFTSLKQTLDSIFLKQSICFKKEI